MSFKPTKPAQQTRNFDFFRIFNFFKLNLCTPKNANIWICPFRPFFFICALHGIVAMVVWLAFLVGFCNLLDVIGGPIIWHAHEMIFGFAMAPTIGFLLTAVPEFTHQPCVSSRHLKTLLVLWLAARLSFTFSAALGALGIWPAMIFDSALLLILLAAIIPPLWRQPERRHMAFVYNLIILFAVHLGFYVALLQQGNPMAWLKLALGALMTLIIVALSRISMRLVNDVLQAQGGESAAYLARPPRRNLAIFAIGAYSLGEFFMPGNTVNGWLALAAAAAIANLLNDWHVGRALFQRWVLIPYLTYVGMIIGYALIGFALLSGNDLNSTGEHILAINSMALAILLVMSVAGRMHSGWGLDHRRWLPIAACVFLVAALCRAAFNTDFINSTASLHAAATFWIIGWCIYLAYSYKPLLGPRPDQRSGCDEAAPVTDRS